MSSLYADLVDAIYADLEASAGLPDHATQLYRRPLAVLPEDCPLLCVWVMDKTPNLSMGTTVTFDSTVVIGISWHVAVDEEAVSLERQEANSIDPLAVLEALEARVHYLSVSGISVDACHEVLPGSSTPNDRGLATGLVEGYATSVLCRIVET